MPFKKSTSQLHEKALEDYLRGDMTLADIARKYGLKPQTVRTWKCTRWKKRLEEEKQNLARKNACKDITDHTLEQSANPLAGGIDKPAPRKPGKRAVNIIDIERELADNTEYKALDERKKKFVDEYLKNGGNAKQAYLLAYKCKPSTAIGRGHELTKIPAIRDIIESKRAERAAAAHVDADYVLINAKQVVARCLQSAPVMIFDKQKKEYVQAKTEEGQPIYQFDSKGANQALELIAKSLGMLTDNHSIHVDGSVSLSSMSDEELLREYNRQVEASNTIDVTPEE